MLFIITHQVYELWFKQINFEIKAIANDFSAQTVNEKNVGIAVARLGRIIEIMKLLIQQLGVMETMTPLDFLDFRRAHGPKKASFEQDRAAAGHPCAPG
jgi:tryptophan 2,3-dioxygenase